MTIAAPPPAVLDAFTEPRPHEQPEEEEEEEDRNDPIAVVYASRTGPGSGHVVGIVGGTQQLTCTCPSGLALFSRPRGCWAMVETRRLLGFDPVA